ncbi:MAG TPA: ATP-binding protein [Candidatus Binataceae bacterium]
MQILLAVIAGLVVGGLAAYALVRRAERRYEVRLLELDLERSKIEAIIESVEDGLIVLDPSSAIVHINEVACAILGLEPHTVGTAKLERLAADNPHVARLVAARGSLDGEGAIDSAVEFKLFLRGRDHSYIHRELAWTGPGGERLGAILLLQDVTLLRDQERSRANLIATLSHELKTPLTSLAIAAELLVETTGAAMAPRERELLDTIRDDIGRLQAIAGNLLDASRSSAARIAVERRAIMLDRVVRDICRPLKLQADEKRIKIEIISDERPIPIWGDPIKLPWVITNLVGNALRYSPVGGRITLEISHDATTARVTVADSGPGIAPELMPRIFEPYAQFPDDASQMGSAGLGLHIAKEIVEAHNGRIYVESERGRGTTFAVEIPLREETLG